MEKNKQEEENHIEIKEKQNKLAGITVIFLSLLGLIGPLFLLIFIY